VCWQADACPTNAYGAKRGVLEELRGTGYSSARVSYRQRQGGASNFECETLDPRDPRGPRVKVVLPGDLITRVYKWQRVSYENLRCVKHVLEVVECIFFGIREYNEGGWCYTGRPERWHVTAERVEPFPDDLIYAVYVNPRMRIYEWRAEDVAVENRGCPKNWQQRYRGRVL